MTEIFNDNWKIIYGDWQYDSMSGGFKSHESSYNAGLDKLIIKPIGKFEGYADNMLIISGKIIIKIQTENVLEVEFDPPGYLLQLQDRKSINFQGNDTLYLNGICLDCFTYLFTRVKE